MNQQSQEVSQDISKGDFDPEKDISGEKDVSGEAKEDGEEEIKEEEGRESKLQTDG